jgi:hypothetical protein
MRRPIDPRGPQARLLKFYVRPEVADQLEQKAQLDGRSMSGYLRRLVESVVDDQQTAGAA